MIGIIALVLLGGAAALWIWPLEAGWYQPLLAACSRLGPFMAALWLAYDQVKALPPWLAATIPMLIFILAVRPKWFVILLPIVIAIAVLRPKSPPRR
jgi:hypothetical protein